MKTDLPETFRRIAYEALKQTYALHENLGDAGQDTVQKNAFGDEAMVLDIESERAMIE